METVTISGKDFKLIHNTLCELREVEHRLNELISESMATKLARVVSGFEQGLKDAYAQDNSAWDRKYAYYNRFREENGLTSIWSIFKLEEHGFLRDHPWTGAREVCYRDHWGDDTVYETILGPTWADLYRAADRCVQRSGDGHHCFIESFATVADHPHQLRLTTGS